MNLLTGRNTPSFAKDTVYRFTFAATNSRFSSLSEECSQYRILWGCKFTSFLKND
jgi:hypothetical protein